MQKIIWPVISVAIAVGIFISSSMTGDASGSASWAIANLVRRVVYVSDETLASLHFLVRKTSHFSVYFALAFSVAQSLRFHIHSSRKLLLAAWSITAVYGVLDEVHQYFVPGRMMAFSDMAINAAGAFLGALVVVWYVSYSRLRAG